VSGVNGKVVAITGASSGIGAATALELAARGAAVVLGARRTDRLKALAERIRGSGGRAEILPVDVTRRTDLEHLVATAVERFERLDVLVSNAGIARTGPVAELDVDSWDAMIDVNLRGVLHGIAAALPVFRRQGRGHFVTTVSTSGLKIVPTQAVYAGTKNAVRTLLEALRQESTDGVLRTTSISPGYVRTELADYIDDPGTREQVRHRMATLGIGPDAVARAVAFAIEQPDDVEIGDITIRPASQNLRRWRRSGDRGLHQFGDLLLHHGAPALKRVRHRPHVTVIEVRRVLEAQGRVAVAELARILEEDDDLAVRVRVSGHPVPGLGRQPGGGRGHRHVHALGERTILRCHPRDAVEDRLQAIGLLGALVALGAQLGGAVLHRRTLLGAEAAELGLGILRGHSRASFPDTQESVLLA
jgi:NADP-dependent 3-hydroxy acid dehydrogenase YdfG